MKTKLVLFIFLFSSVSWSQQLEFQYTSQQLNVYNSLTTDIPIFTQNFDDQVSGAIPIVPFTIGGQAYNTLFVSTNGFITLGQAASSTNYNPISQPQGMPVIAPFAGNLESANNNARISYTIVNSFGNVPTSIIIQWKNVRRFGMQGESFSFQAKLNFTSWILPTIDFIYGDFSSVNNTQTPMEVGIRIGTGNAPTEFQNIQVNNGGAWGIGAIAAKTKSVFACACFHLIGSILTFSPLISNSFDNQTRYIIFGICLFSWIIIVNTWEKSIITQK